MKKSKLNLKSVYIKMKGEVRNKEKGSVEIENEYKGTSSKMKERAQGFNFSKIKYEVKK